MIQHQNRVARGDLHKSVSARVIQRVCSTFAGGVPPRRAGTLNGIPAVPGTPLSLRHAEWLRPLCEQPATRRLPTTNSPTTHDGALFRDVLLSSICVLMTNILLLFARGCIFSVIRANIHGICMTL